MLTWIIVAAVAVAATLAVLVATRPGTFHVERSTVMHAPASAVFAQVQDLRAWGGWNPFERDDPRMTKRYEGPESGVGSAYHYAGGRSGEGRMTLTELRPAERVGVRAEFIRPFRATHHIEFTLRPVAEGTAVTWSISGRNGVPGRLIGVFFSQDRMIGGPFERGLAALKRIAEDGSGRVPAGV